MKSKPFFLFLKGKNTEDLYVQASNIGSEQTHNESRQNFRSGYSAITTTGSTPILVIKQETARKIKSSQDDLQTNNYDFNPRFQGSSLFKVV